jgi:hypothetical protein
MWWRVLLVGALLAGLLGACAIVDPVDNRYDTVSRSLAKARNESIFLNLVRASHDYPLSFSIVGNVTPTLTNTTSFALPSFLLGPHIPSFGNPGTNVASPLFTPGRDVIFGNTTAGNTTQVQTGFTVSTQETSAFYQGFLKPIDLQTLAYFIRQGYSRELLFWLFTDSFTLELPNAPPFGYHYSPPDDYGCSQIDPKHRCFIDWVRNAAYTGLTVEEKTEQGGSSSPPKGGASSGGSTKGTSYARFCFNPVLAQQAASSVAPALVQIAQGNLDVQRSVLFKSNLTCGSPEWKPTENRDVAQADILPLTFSPTNSESGPKISFTITPRSAYGVFVFLGTLMKMQREHLEPTRYAFIPPNRPYAAEPPVLETVNGDPALITVMQNLGGQCFVHTWFEDGDYCVPEQAATTKRIFGLLAQLIAIQTAAADLSITPVVRVIQ